MVIQQYRDPELVNTRAISQALRHGLQENYRPGCDEYGTSRPDMQRDVRMHSAA